MLTKCQECGVIFKTDNPKRKTCYNCKAELQFIIHFPEIMAPTENTKPKKQ